MRTLLVFVLLIAACFAPGVAFAQDALPAAILNFEGENVPEEMTSTLSSIVRNEAMQIDKYRVTNQFPIRLSEVLAVLGCSKESPSCLQQVAEHAEVRVLIFGDVEQTSETYKLSLSIFDSETGRMLNTLSRTVTETEDPMVSFRKEIETFFAEERGEARTQIRIGSNVDGAEVRIDEVFVGVTPIERKGLPAGNYLIVVSHPSYTSYRETVQLRRGGSIELWAELMPVSEEVAATAPAPEATKPAPADTGLTATDTRRDDGPRWGPILTVGFGGAALVTSAVFGIALESVERTVEEESRQGTLTAERYDELSRRGRNFQLAHHVLLGVGAAATVGGMIWLVWNGDDGAADPEVSLGVSPAGLDARVRW